MLLFQGVGTLPQVLHLKRQILQAMHLLGDGGDLNVHGARVFGEARSIRVRHHAANVVTKDVDRARDAQVVYEQRVQILGHDGLGVAVARVGGMAGAAIIRSNDAEASVAEGRDDVAELVRCFRKGRG